MDQLGHLTDMANVIIERNIKPTINIKPTYSLMHADIYNHLGCLASNYLLEDKDKIII